jgi:hypothetical protein
MDSDAELANQLALAAHQATALNQGPVGPNSYAACNISTTALSIPIL